MINFTPALKLFASYRLSKLNSLHSQSTQQQQLFALIKKARNTKFGVDHKFHSIDSVKKYQELVPLRKYEDFWNQYWKDSYPKLLDCTWPGLIPFFPLSSGTSSGTTKYIPCTKEMLRSNTKAGLDLLSFHVNNKPDSKIFGGKNFFLGGSTDLRNEIPGVQSGDLSGIIAKNIPWWIAPRYFPPPSLALISDWEQKVSVLAEKSLTEDIRMVSGVPAWLLIFFQKLFDLKPNKSLAEIYPNLELVVHGGVNFSPYYKQFSDLLLGSKAELREVYPASEGFIATADRGYGEGLRLNLDNGLFYEFIPFEELNSENPTRHWIGNIQKDVNYAIALTTCAGLWSYILGDTVRFIETNPPRLLITGRTSYYLSAFGEHLIPEEIENSISLAASKHNLTIEDYSVGAIFPKNPSELGGHLYVVEFAQSIEEVNNKKIDLLNDLDKKLCELNEDYAGHRAKGFGLNPPRILVAKKGSFTAWMKSRGKLGGQNKVPRIINNKELFEDLISFNEKY